MIGPTPGADDPPRPELDALALPARSAAAQRRAMQAAIANAVRAMRTSRAQPARRGTRRSPPDARA